jgi:hypothetical protein
MFKVLILVCSAQLAHQDCGTGNATDVIWGPDAASEITCALSGQAYVAETAIANGIGDNRYLKVVCIRQTEMPMDPAGRARSEVDN